MFKLRAETVIAACAVIGIGLVLYQNIQLIDVISSAHEAFRAQSYPIVKFDRYSWHLSKKELSCEIPAIGISTYYRNMSGVPVIVEKSALKIAIGDRTIASDPEITIPRTRGEIIMAPGESKVISFTHSKVFGPMYKRLRSNHPPFLNLDLDIIYRSMISGKRYNYTGKIQLYFDCRSPKIKSRAVKIEAIDEIVRR